MAALGDGPFTVGFAAETEDVIGHARAKLTNKSVDMMAANLVGPDCGFDQETNALTVLWDGGEVALDQAPKAMLAQRLIAVIAERFHAQRGSAGAAPQAGTPAP